LRVKHTDDVAAVPAWPVIAIELTAAGHALVNATPVPAGENARAAAIEAAARYAARLGRPVRATATEADGTSWPLIIHPDATVSAAGGPTKAKHPRRRALLAALARPESPGPQQEPAAVAGAGEERAKPVGLAELLTPGQGDEPDQPRLHCPQQRHHLGRRVRVRWAAAALALPLVAGVALAWSPQGRDQHHDLATAPQDQVTSRDTPSWQGMPQAAGTPAVEPNQAAAPLAAISGQPPSVPAPSTAKPAAQALGSGRTSATPPRRFGAQESTSHQRARQVRRTRSDTGERVADGIKLGITGARLGCAAYHSVAEPNPLADAACRVIR
jgi:hypothetical protein